MPQLDPDITKGKLNWIYYPIRKTHSEPITLLQFHAPNLYWLLKVGPHLSKLTSQKGIFWTNHIATLSLIALIYSNNVLIGYKWLDTNPHIWSDKQNIVGARTSTAPFVFKGATLPHIFNSSVFFLKGEELPLLSHRLVKKVLKLSSSAFLCCKQWFQLIVLLEDWMVIIYLLLMSLFIFSKNQFDHSDAEWRHHPANVALEHAYNLSGRLQRTFCTW